MGSLEKVNWYSTRLNWWDGGLGQATKLDPEKHGRAPPLSELQPAFVSSRRRRDVVRAQLTNTTNLLKTRQYVRPDLRSHVRDNGKVCLVIVKSNPGDLLQRRNRRDDTCKDLVSAMVVVMTRHLCTSVKRFLYLGVLS